MDNFETEKVDFGTGIVSVTLVSKSPKSKSPKSLPNIPLISSLFSAIKNSAYKTQLAKWHLKILKDAEFARSSVEMVLSEAEPSLSEKLIDVDVLLSKIGLEDNVSFDSVEKALDYLTKIISNAESMYGTHPQFDSILDNVISYARGSISNYYLLLKPMQEILVVDNNLMFKKEN